MGHVANRRIGLPRHWFEYSSVLERSDQQLPGPILYLQWSQTDTRYLIEKVDIREPIWRVYEQMARQPVVVGNVMIL